MKKEIISLNGSWDLKEVESGERLSARVPGDVTVDYYRAGKIADPYFGMNYKSERYLLERDYEYSKKFSARPVQAGERCLIAFEGIDTFSEIALNGVLLGKTENMFLRYEFDVTELLREENVLTVTLRSTLKRMGEIDAEKYFACFNKERIFLRKAQCHFGWDWAPDLPGYGIWGDVTLAYVSETRIENVRCVTNTDGAVSFFTELNYNIRTERFSCFAKSDVLRYTLERAPASGFANACVKEAPLNGAKNFINFRVENPALWMPSGYGQPNLYAYKIELLRDGAVIDTYEGKLGIRTVRLEEKPIGDDRYSFRLVVNGQDIFVKGSNWVPCECFTGTADDGRYERLVRLAAEGNLNMLRVWGGGIYEKDVFYRLCDELGIMVWQDFMFACADIPESDGAFVANVVKECIYQTKRLRNHPSIVYWCGGNEKTGSCGLLKQYGDFLVDVTIRGIVEHYDGTRPYVRQSPFSRTDVGNDPESGETHGTAFDPTSLQSLEEFYKNSFDRRVSFASECAVMGSCVPESYRNFVPEEELWPLGAIYDDRFCDNPYGAIMSFVERQTRMAGMLFGPSHGIDEFAVKSMAVQAEALKIEIANARRSRAVCGGFLNWMFDDIWPTGTWSVVDYYLRPKAAYYTLKREYAPVRAFVVPDGRGSFYGYIVNDTLCDLALDVISGGVTTDGEYANERRLSLAVPKCSVAQTGAIVSRGDILFLEITSKEFRQTAHAFQKPFRDYAFASDYDVAVEKSVKTQEGYVTKLTITARKFLRMARIDTDGAASYSDNFFDVLPERSKEIEIKSESPVGKVGVKDFTYYHKGN